VGELVFGVGKVAGMEGEVAGKVGNVAAEVGKVVVWVCMETRGVAVNTLESGLGRYKEKLSVGREEGGRKGGDFILPSLPCLHLHSCRAILYSVLSPQNVIIKSCTFQY
jgi:hypothetical protein